MLVTISRWLVLFGLNCERCSGQARLREGEESECGVQVEALGGRENRKGRTKCR